MSKNIIIEKIENGFIAKIESEKVFYPSLKAMALAEIVEPLVEQDTVFKEHDMVGETLKIEFDIKVGDEING